MKCTRCIYSYLLWWLRRCHMSVMASPITSHSTVCPTVCSGWYQRKHRSSTSPVLCEGNPLVTGGFSSKRPVMQKAFPRHDVTMTTHGCLVHAKYPWLILVKLTDIVSQRNTAKHAMFASFLRFTVHQCFIRYIFDVYEIHKMFCYWILPLGYQSR